MKSCNSTPSFIKSDMPPLRKPGITELQNHIKWYCKPLLVIHRIAKWFFSHIITIISTKLHDIMHIWTVSSWTHVFCLFVFVFPPCPNGTTKCGHEVKIFRPSVVTGISFHCLRQLWRMELLSGNFSLSQYVDEVGS